MASSYVGIRFFNIEQAMVGLVASSSRKTKFRLNKVSVAYSV